jgi:hypothetical protein
VKGFANVLRHASAIDVVELTDFCTPGDDQ